MGYRRVSEDLLYQILVRLKKGESHRRIAVELKLDKKTVNHYATMIDGLMDMPAGDYVATLAVLATLLPKNEKPKPAYMVLNVYAEEIKALIEGDKMAHLEGMKPKTAWDVICHRHELAEKTSYETFKRFVRTSVVLAPHVPAVARIEVNPGEETQIDYGSVGIIPEQDHFRRVSAFVGVLSASRLPFIQFCTTQDQVSFSLCVSDMFSFYQGVSARLNLDNLKAGILSPDIYDPTLNRTFAELCEHYDTIADPARICSPKDKGKIERIIPLARELYRSLRAKYPDENLQFLNAKALIWCTEDYGKRKHGTTGIPPMLAFRELEQPCLRPLPRGAFVPASWTTAKVHPDQFIQVHGKYYGLPALFIGKRVEVRSTSTTIEIYSDHHIVRTYPLSSRRRSYLPNDFPPWAEPFVPGSYANYLVSKADELAPIAGSYLRAIILEQGNLGLRRAQGCLAILARYRSHPDFEHLVEVALHRHLCIPAQLRSLFEAPELPHMLIPLPLSDRGKAMARSATYYLGS